MRYIKQFKTSAQFNDFKLDSINTPNISLIENLISINGGLIFTPYIVHDYSLDYFTLVALQNCEFTVTPPSGGISYSLDEGKTWTEKSGDELYINVSAGNKVLLKGDLFELSSYNEEEEEELYDAQRVITSDGRYEVEGNIMSLLYEDDFTDKFSLIKESIFANFFASNEYLINAKNLVLPATTVSISCYEGMFYNCTSLMTAPQLPATTLAYSCYGNMFKDCTSLTTAPQLPATTLSNYCYKGMFTRCTSLTTAPQLPATLLTNGCYYEMFEGCTSLTTAPTLSATSLTSSCYTNMFKDCTSLTTAPELSATTLAGSCYKGMFRGCTSLTTAPVLSATALEGQCYQEMFMGCTSLTTAPELPAMILKGSCYANMFYYCTSLITAPVLNATTLESSCYSGMFQNCESLTTAPELPATTLKSSCYNGMFRGCTSLITAPELPATTLVSYCYECMFMDCTSLNYVKCLATSNIKQGYSRSWLLRVNSSGTFVKDANANWPSGTDGIPEGWTIDTV